MISTAAANIRIILVEPAGPLNVGSVARVLKNMGLHQLVLVNPQCDYLGTEARLMAVRAADILENARVVESLPAALVGCTRAIATTGDDRPLATKPEAPADALPWLLEAPSALIFGREDCGLTNAELNYAQRLIRIPSSDAYTSLNLAQAVAVCCYELYKLVVNPPLPPPWGEKKETPPNFPQAVKKEDASASLENLEGYYQQLETLLLKVGYLHPHTAASRMAKFRHLYNRAYPSVGEVAMLRGILRQVEWAIRKTHPIGPVSDSLDQALPDYPAQKASEPD